MIFYFSGTGNTRWAAEKLAAATGERLISMSSGTAAAYREQGHCNDGEDAGNDKRSAAYREQGHCNDGEDAGNDKRSAAYREQGHCNDGAGNDKRSAAYREQGHCNDGEDAGNDKRSAAYREQGHCNDGEGAGPDDKRHCNFRLEEGERIGFCFPVHGWQVPGVVKRFLETVVIHGAETHYAYALCTCGDTVGLAMNQFETMMRKKGIIIRSSLSLIMPESYVALPFMYTDTPEREAEKKRQAAEDLQPFIQAVKERQEGYEQVTKGPLPWLFSHVIGSYFNQHMITDKKFMVDEDVCIHCGRCASVCPVGDIAFDKIPSWKHDSSCTCCLSCYHHCPVHAINYGKITRKRGQYYYK